MSDNGAPETPAIGQLAAALAKAQAAFPKVLKDREAKIESPRGRYSYRYADLASLIEAVRKPLADNGLAYVQPIRIGPNGHVLVTRLLHISGASLESEYMLRDHERPQEMGSEITYARRYALSALLGVASEEDDDGTAAQTAEPSRRSQPYTGSEPPFDYQPPKPERVKPAAATPEPKIEENRAFLSGRVLALAKERTLTPEEKTDVVTTMLDGKSTDLAAIPKLNQLYLFLSDAEAVSQWRAERTTRAAVAKAETT